MYRNSPLNQASAAHDSRAEARRQARATRWVWAMLAIFGALWPLGAGDGLGLAHYLPLHIFLEGASVIAAMLCFGVAWNADSRSGNAVIIGAVLFGASLIDFGHLLSFPGMPNFVTAADTQMAIAFWLPARYLVACGLLAIALRPWQSALRPATRHRAMAGVLAYVIGTYCLALLQPARLPEFMVAGSLNGLAIGLEYGLCVTYSVAAGLFYRQARRGARFSAADLFAVAAIAAISELCFALYASVGDLFDLAGHLYRIVSYGFIYRAVFRDSVRQPLVALRKALATERRWAAEQHSLVRTFDMLDEAVLEIAADGCILIANRGWSRLAGAEPKGRANLLDSLHQDDRSNFRLRLAELAAGTKSEFRGRFRFHTNGRPDQWMECRFVADRDDAGLLLNVRGVMSNITKAYLQERHIAHLSLYDALTDLPNRALLEDRIRKAIQLANRNHHSVAVCFLDLDHFKNVNDAYGHKTGDALLQTIARTIKAALRDGDTLARWGGDEFVILLPDLTSPDDPRRVAQKVMTATRQTFDIDGLSLSASFTMGISVFPEDGDDISQLLAQADRAMFYAKSQGRNSIQLFSEMVSKGVGKKDLYVQARLAAAIRDELVSVWFQPLVAVGPGPDHAISLAGVEALARWHDADLGWVPPASFIPMAESLGLIEQLGHLVRRQALAHFARWRRTHPRLHLALNVSKRQLFATSFFDELLADVEHHGLSTAAVTLEVTESVALMDVEFAEDRLQQLAAAGFTLSIDDFGTGYASLSQLHELPVRELKIDISFVRRVHTPEGLRMVQAIVNLAQALSLRTVAEGIEDEASAATVRDLGVDLLQGYHFGRPCPAQDFEVSALFASATLDPRAEPDKSCADGIPAYPVAAPA